MKTCVILYIYINYDTCRKRRYSFMFMKLMEKFFQAIEGTLYSLWIRFLGFSICLYCLNNLTNPNLFFMDLDYGTSLTCLFYFIISCAAIYLEAHLERISFLLKISNLLSGTILGWYSLMLNHFISAILFLAITIGTLFFQLREVDENEKLEVDENENKN